MPNEPDNGQAEEDFAERTRLIALTADVGRALTTYSTLADMLRGCAEALVTRLDAAFARIWTLNAAEDVLELQASAGQYTHLNGPHGRVPVGQLKIGLIAQERRPHLTNAVIGDPRVGNQDWARREGMVAFAGYPLVVDDQLVGVAAMFARRPLSEVTLQAIGSVADQIAVGIERKRAEEALRDSEERYRITFAHAAVGMALTDPRGRFLQVNPRFCAITGHSERELLSAEFASLIHPDDLPANTALMQRMLAGSIPSFVSEMRCLRKEGRTVWVQNSVSLTRDSRGEPAGVISLIQDITERRTTQAELAAAFRRELVLNRIGQVIRRSQDAGEIEQMVVRQLGEALAADRCFLIFLDERQDEAEFVADWHRPDLRSIVGKHRLSEFVVDLQEIFFRGNALVVGDLEDGQLSPVTRAVLAQMQIRALLAVPWFDGGRVVGVLGVSFADHSHAWTAEEIALVEQVAAMTRAAIETARDAQRQRRIAAELQDALQPPVSAQVPNLRIAPFMRAALDEAEVGGDFYDVFPLDKELYALVIGDVSGKGLPAAAQLATVRNSLRTTLYLYRRPAEAVTSLNTILTAHDLLTGFVTAFVGIYDAGTGQITYACCGHEPALIRRAATGDVEALTTTGTPLGAAENAVYTEQTVGLSEGDVLLLYTDGLSEAGPNRREMMGTSGLIRLLAAMPPGEDVHAAAARIVADAHAYADGVFRDDVCVLLMRRQQSDQLTG